MSRLDDIRAWRDQTEGIYGLPHYPSDPPMVTNNKGWWRDVDTLLLEVDRLSGLAVAHGRDTTGGPVTANDGQSGDSAEQRVRYMLDRQNEAFVHCPTGSLAQRWIPGICKHAEVRCTHGDEIVGRRFRRRVCMVCGRSLRGPLPGFCFFTGTPHNGRPSDG